MIMQCKPYNPHKMELPVYGQVKMNGIFGRWEQEKQYFLTRSGKIIQGLTVLQQELKYFPSFDGELVIPNIPFFEMNGLIRSHNETPDCMFYVFDQPLQYVSTKIRLKSYTELLDRAALPHVHPLKRFLLNDQEDVDTFYTKVLIAGHEGVVYKSLYSKYYNGKRWYVQKRVPEDSTECPIIGFVEGKKAFIGMLGAFLVDYNGIPVKVGGGIGLTHDFRKTVWDTKDKYMGQMMKVSYKSVTPKGSLQSPKYIGMRWDI